LKRCTSTEMRWCRKLTSLDSTVLRAFIEHRIAQGPQVRYAASGSVYCI